MTRKAFAVSRPFARELRRVSEKMDREGGIPHAQVHAEWLADMAAELRRLAKVFGRTGRGAKELLEGLMIAEVQGVDPRMLEELRRELGEKISRRRRAA